MPDETNQPNNGAAPEVNPVTNPTPEAAPTQPVATEQAATPTTPPATEQPAAPDTSPGEAEAELEAEAQAEQMAALKQKYSLPVEEPKPEKGNFFSNLTTPMKVALVVVGVAILGVLLVWLRHDNPVENADDDLTEPVSQVVSQQTISVEEIEGTLETSQTTTSLDDATFSPATTTTTVEEGQFVRSGESSRAILGFSDDSEVRLGANTTIFIDAATEERIEVTLGTGEIFNRVTDNSNRSFIINTDNDTFRALGTAFRAVQNDQVEGIESYENKVTSKDDVTVDEGKAYLRDKTGSDGAQITDLDKDAVKNDEFLLWNRERDLSKDEYKDKLGFLKDFEGPALEATAPATTKDANITITGTTDTNALISVNGQSVAVAADTGAFSTSIALEIGANDITIVATDPLGNTTEKKLTITREEEVAEETADITLVGETGTTGIDLVWTLAEGFTSPQGFKIVYNTTGTPVFGADASQFSDDLGTVLPKKDGQSYFIRVCAFNEDANTCNNYSNQVQVTAPQES